MKISELIGLLQWHDPETEVFIAQPTHNYWGEVNALDVGTVEWDIVGSDNVIYDEIAVAIANSDGYEEKVVIHAW